MTTTRMTVDDAKAAVGKSVQYRATGQFATVVRVNRDAVLIRYERGGTHWVAAESLDRRADRDTPPADTFDEIDEHARYMADLARYDADERNDR
jgi:hypothetical protein